MALVTLLCSLVLAIQCQLSIIAASYPKFDPLNEIEHLFTTNQQATNANILENAYCEIFTFKDDTSSKNTNNDNNYYHWQTQSTANTVNVSVFDDYIEPYNNTDSDLSKQLPHMLYGSYASFDSCKSPITNDIITCYIVPSCCFGCAFILCDIFFNNGSNPIWIDLNYAISGNENSGNFAQKPQVQCMDDGYLVSWIFAHRISPTKQSTNMNKCIDNDHQTMNIDDDIMIFSNYSIQYGTIDLYGNAILTNQTLHEFDTLSLEVAINNFEMLSVNDTNVLMTYAKNDSDYDTLNVSYLISAYSGIKNKLTVKHDNTVMLMSTMNGNESAVYNMIFVDVSVSMDCCVLFSAKRNGVWVIVASDIHGNVLSIQNGNESEMNGSNIEFANVIELAMLNLDNNNNNKYILLLFGQEHNVSSSHEINGISFMVNETGIINDDNNANSVYMFVNDSQNINNEYFYSFCANILPDSDNIVVSWTTNPYQVNQNVNGFVQSWTVSLN